MRRLLTALALSIAACVPHKPPTPPPTPSPTVAPTATPSPTPAPTPSLPPGLLGACWGCDGSKAEDATGQGWIYPRTAKRYFNTPHFWTGTCRHSSEEPIDDAVRSWAPFLAQAVAEGSYLAIEPDWSDAVYAGGIESEIVSAPHVDVAFDVVAPFRANMAYWYVVDEGGLTKPMVAARAAYIRKLEKAHGWAPLPVAGGFLEDELFRLDGHLASDLQIVFTEAGYAAEFGSGNRAEDARLIHDSLARQRPLIPADKVCATWCADYNRNGARLEWNTDGGWAHSKEDLAALVFECRKTAKEFGCEKIVSSFCEVRAGSCPDGYCGGGWWDWRELAEPQLARAKTYLETGTDPGPQVPAGPTPTPVPTPIVGPGVLTLERNTWDFPAGTERVQWYAYRKDGKQGRVTFDWTAVCDVPGDDCQTFGGVATMEDGQDAVNMSFDPGPQTQPGHRRWHFRLSNPTGGLRLETGDQPMGGNLQLWASDSSLNFLTPSVAADPGNPWAIWWIRGDCSQPVSITWCVEQGTLTESDLDAGPGSKVWCQNGGMPSAMAAGSCRVSWQLATNAGAVRGHKGTMRFKTVEPDGGLGRVPTCVLEVR